jgi:hypothetical protein
MSRRSARHGNYYHPKLLTQGSPPFDFAQGGRLSAALVCVEGPLHTTKALSPWLSERWS